MDAEWRRYRIGQAAGWLEKVRGMGARVSALEAEIEDLRARAEGLGAVDYTRERVSRSARSDATAEAAQRLFDALERHADELTTWLEARMRARSCLDGLRDEEGRAVLVRHYFVGETWREVAGAMGLAESSVYRLRDDALCDLYDLMPYSERDPRPPAV